MPGLPPGRPVDRTVTLPAATGGSFWLDGSAWELPGQDTADVLVDRLVRIRRAERAVELLSRGVPASEPARVRCARRRMRAPVRALVTLPGSSWARPGLAWPPLKASGDPYSDRINTMRKVVVSTTLTDPRWANTEVVAGDVAARVRDLKGEDGGHIVPYGFGDVSTFELVDSSVRDHPGDLPALTRRDVTADLAGQPAIAPAFAKRAPLTEPMSFATGARLSANVVPAVSRGPQGSRAHRPHFVR